LPSTVPRPPERRRRGFRGRGWSASFFSPGGSDRDRLLNPRRIPAAGTDGLIGDRRKRFETQAAAQGLQSKAFLRSDIAQANIGAEAANQIGLLVAEGRLPNQARSGIAHQSDDLVKKTGADFALLVVNADALAALPAFDDHPGGAPGQILQDLLGQFLSRRLPLRIFAANLGDGDKPRVARAVYDPSATASGQVDRPLGDLDRPEPQLLRVSHEDAAMLLNDGRFDQGAAGISQDVALTEQGQLLLKDRQRHQRGSAEAEFPMIDMVARQRQNVA